MKKITHKFILLIFSLVNLLNLAPLAHADSSLNSASQFITSVALSNNDGAIGANKISDSSSVNVTYNMAIPDGVIIDTSKAYTMPLPMELKYQTTSPIQLKKADGTLLGQVTIENNVISIVFEPTINTLSNRTLFFNFWSNFNKDTLNYDTGNNLIFPTKTDPNNKIHINFSKSNSGGGSGASAISKTLRYGDDNTVIWTITINNGGYSVDDANFIDTMENTQNYIPGSTTINFRNYKNNIIKSSTEDLNFIPNSDGTQSVSMNFGRLYSDDEAVTTEPTSIVIRYQSKMIYNSGDNKYPNHAYSYDQNTLIDGAVSTATYRGQGGGGGGDVAGDVTVKYVDEEGNPLSDDVIITGNIGDNYTTEQKEIDGYTFKQVQGNTAGSFSEQAQTVTYVYTKNPVAGGDVTVKYLDEEGNPLSDDMIITGNIGDNYTTEQKEIDGYTFKQVQGNTAGSFSEQAQTVTYVYTKNPVAGGDVTVKYVDEEGNPLSDDVIITGNIGDNYTTEQKEIDGYTFKKVQGDTTGQFTNSIYTIIYIYTKNNVSNPVPIDPDIPTAPNPFPSTVVNPSGSKTTPIKPLSNSLASSNVVKQLPETGNDKKSSILLTFIGFLISSFMVLGLGLKKYKEKY